jgi:hypothetical protein
LKTTIICDPKLYSYAIAGRKSNWSFIGRPADGNEIGVTMELDLLNGLPPTAETAIPRMKFLVMHEFGHALGLQHEHQRGDLWSCIRDFVKIGRMKGDIRGLMGQMSNADFDDYWRNNW